jgi:hypothetical protein
MRSLAKEILKHMDGRDCHRVMLAAEHYRELDLALNGQNAESAGKARDPIFPVIDERDRFRAVPRSG